MCFVERICKWFGVESFLKVQNYIFKATLNLDFPKHTRNVKASSQGPLKVGARRVCPQMATQVALEKALPLQLQSLFTFQSRWRSTVYSFVPLTLAAALLGWALRTLICSSYIG